MRKGKNNKKYQRLQKLDNIEKLMATFIKYEEIGKIETRE